MLLFNLAHVFQKWQIKLKAVKKCNFRPWLGDSWIGKECTYWSYTAVIKVIVARLASLFTKCTFSCFKTNLAYLLHCLVTFINRNTKMFKQRTCWYDFSTLVRSNDLSNLPRAYLSDLPAEGAVTCYTCLACFSFFSAFRGICLFIFLSSVTWEGCTVNMKLQPTGD